MDIGDMRKKFDDIISSIISKKRDDNTAFLNHTQYNNRIADVKRSKTILQTPGSTKTVKEYRMIKKYDILTINGKERLIQPVTDNSAPVLYITNEELFDILHSTHSAIGHGGRNRMFAELKSKYYNITIEAVMTYLRLCVHCQKKSTNPKKSLVSKPISHSTFNSRAQVDLIDMQPQSYNDFRFIMVYQDHLTKFVLLRALKSKRAEEVSFHLLDIFTTIGAPAILHSDEGLEFVNSVLTELHSMWSDVKIVHGKPRHSESQGSVERANRDIEEMLSAWMAENNCRNWPSGLKFIQFQKNRTFHSGITRSPYEAVFGCPARIGLASTSVPLDKIANLKTEEDVEAAVESPQSSNLDNVQIHIKSEVAGDEIWTTISELAPPFKEEQIELDSQAPLRCEVCLIALPLGIDSICLNCKTQSNIFKERKRSTECLDKQARKVIKLSNDNLSEVEVETTV